MLSLLKEIETLVPNLSGWCSVEKAQRLAAIIVALHPTETVEIGIFAGRSFLPMALAHKFIKHGHLTAIDPWSAEASTEGYFGENLAYWRALNHDAIANEFMSRLTAMDLRQLVTVHRQKSDDVEPVGAIDLLHIDGQHTVQALRDAQRYGSCVRAGGIVVMDDLDWKNDGNPDVERAADWLENNGFWKLYPLGTGAVFQRYQ